jgi:hypothetical protein
MLGGCELCKDYADKIHEHRQGYALYEGLVLFVSVGMLHIRHGGSVDGTLTCGRTGKSSRRSRA